MLSRSTVALSGHCWVRSAAMGGETCYVILVHVCAYHEKYMLCQIIYFFIIMHGTVRLTRAVSRTSCFLVELMPQLVVTQGFISLANPLKRLSGGRSLSFT